MVYDLIILGAGPAGYLAAERAGHAGMSVALVEERSLGGVCLNEGCIPTKTLLYSAKLYEGAKLGEKYGVTAQSLAIDHAAVLRRKDKVVKVLVAGVRAAMRDNHVVVINGRGVIEGKDEQGFLVKTGDATLHGNRLLIATGSSPALPPIAGLKEGLASGFALTTREMLDLQEIPPRLCVIGGGVIGLELASYYQTIGSQVSVIEMLDHLLGDTDQDLVAILKAELEKRGIRFELGAKVVGVEKDAVEFEQGGHRVSLPCDKVLVAIGRRPNVEGMGFENLQLAVERGGVVTDKHMRTNVEGVYAAGDVNGRSLLAHTAYREAEVAVNHMLRVEDEMSYAAIPTVLYTNPELASVGETEAGAQQKGIPFKTVKLPMMYSGRYRAENEGGRGVMKLVVNTDTQRVIGAHVLGNYSSEFIVTVASYIELGLTPEQIKKIVFPHPTVSEILREAVFRYE